MMHARSTLFLSSRRRRFAVAAPRLLLLAVLLLLPVFSAQALPPQKVQMAPPATSVLRGDVFLNLSLTVDNEDGLRDLLKDGAVLRLGVAVAVKRERSWWTDVTVGEREYESILRHDPLSRDFVVSFPTPEGEKNLRDKNLTRLLHSSWRKLSLAVIPLRVLLAQGSGENFDIVFSVTLQHTEVPPWLEKSSLFWSSDVVPPEKRVLPFHLPPADAP